jgi:para-aminobenzoate synthetase/4-amino-4-deoxychorismate lyase
MSVRMGRRVLGWEFAPADVLRLVRADAHPVALFGAWAGGYDVVCAEPIRVRSGPGPLADVLDASFTPIEGDASRPAFGGGWIGYLGYSAAGEALQPSGPHRLPAWWFGYYDHALVHDRATGEWFFETLATDDRTDALDRRLANLRHRATALAGTRPTRTALFDTALADTALADTALADTALADTALADTASADTASVGLGLDSVARAGTGSTGALGYEFGPFRLLPGEDGHRDAVGRAVEYIRQGDIFQANICLRAEASFAGDPLDAFCQAAADLQPPYGSFIGVSDIAGTRAAIASLSPELFLRRQAASVVSKPIKGTARRADGAAEAAAQLAELERSAKNRSENVMIVDLVRNDLARVCLPGTVTVPDLLGAEPHPGVWHLVSTVEGSLLPGTTDGDLIRAAFPPGSVTGAPKVRALEVIDEIEQSPREVYTGAIGYRSPVAGLELNVAIRTFEFAAGRAWLGAGGGIVADSDPAAEYAECLIKATPLLTAMGARLDQGAPLPSPQPLPRPSAGVFTSLLVSDGQTVGLARHLARLEASVRDLYGKDLPVSLRVDLQARLAARPSGRLRISVRPIGGPLQARIEVVPLPQVPPVSTAVTLRPVTVPGGIGAHKWRDRRLLAELAARAGPAAGPGGAVSHSPGGGGQVLITDETGELLETDRASFFAVIDGVLLTPPTDGRIIPGTTRAAVMRAARRAAIKVGQKPLTLDQLAAATEVFVTNAVAGVIPVTAIDGCPLTWTPGPVTTILAAALIARPPDLSPPDLSPPALSPPAPGRPDQDPSAPGLSPTRPDPLAHTGAVAPNHGSTEAVAPSRRSVGGAAPPSDGSVGAVAPNRGSIGVVRHTTAGAPSRPLVVLIDNYDSFTWNLAHLLSISGARVEVVRNDEVSAAQVADVGPAGVVISPGPCSPAEAGISIDVVRRSAGLPLLGICLGHQAIAAAFGAAIVRAPRPVHGQAFPVSHDGGGVLAGLPHPFLATRYHSLIVDESTLPPELVITARIGTLPMGLRHVAAPIEGVQFHPESILTTHGEHLIRTFVRSTVNAT